MAIETEGGDKVFATNPDGPHSVLGFVLEKSPRMPRGMEVSVKGKTFIFGVMCSYHKMYLKHLKLFCRALDYQTST